jgi:GT2 family glycosyltransferase
MTVNGCAEAPQFSILTPAYNSSAYIGETISSVLAQTFPSFELLVVDDGSSDDTVAVVEGFARRDSRVVLLRQPNNGAATARNRAIRTARGRYFALIDSDDLWMPEFLAAQHQLLENHQELAVISANAINLGGEWDGQPWKAASDALTPVSLTQMLEVEDSLCIAAVLRREVAETIGGFDPHLLNNEDYDFWLRAAAAGYTCAFYSRPLAYYRRRADSKSSNEQATLRGILRVLEHARTHCANHPAALAIIERRVAEFEHRRLIAGAKSALLGGDFQSAATAFDALRREHGSPYGLMARLTRHAPQVVLWAYAAKSAISPRLPSFKFRH